MWSNRLTNPHPWTSKITVDCLDTRVLEPRWDRARLGLPRWSSPKVKKACLKYEVGLAISSNNIVWINGGYPAGQYADNVIFRDYGLKECLTVGETVEADRAYHDDQIHNLNEYRNYPSLRKWQSDLMWRHEQLNSFLTSWKCLSNAVPCFAKRI